MTKARTVSERFFFDFSHAICVGVSQTLTRSVFFAPPAGARPPAIRFTAISLSPARRWQRA